MSIADDDDLPLLTQVLRTGSGHPPRFEAVDACGQAASLDARFAAFADANDEPPWPRALVIGSDPEPQDGEGRIDDTSPRAVNTDRNTGAIPSSSASLATSGESRRVDLRDNDLFLRSAPTDVAFAGSIDEPPLVMRHTRHRADGGGDAASPNAVSRDVSLVFGGRASVVTRDQDEAFALRIRDSVLQELSARIDTELDARIAQTLHVALETALAHLQASLRLELGEALRDVVGHAVDEAIERLRRES